MAALSTVLALVVPAAPALAADLGVISTFAGTGDYDSAGDGGQATAAKLRSPADVATDAAGNTYIADWWGSKVRKVSPQGVITTFAGTGDYATGDKENVPATSATMKTPASVAVDRAGNVYVADAYDARIRKVGTDGLITTVVGTGTEGFNGDLAPRATNLSGPMGLAFDSSGRLYFADKDNDRIRLVDLAANKLETIAAPDKVNYPTDVAVNALDGAVYIADTDDNKVQKLVNGAFTTVLPNLDHPTGLALDTAGNLYVADSGHNRVQRLAQNGTATSFAGTGTSGAAGDGGQASAAQLNSPRGLAVTRSGDILIGDHDNSKVRRITGKQIDSIVYPVAGTGEWGFGGDGGPAMTAKFAGPNSIAFDPHGNLIVADMVNNRVRRIGTNGVITTIGGTGEEGYDGDNKPATQAKVAPDGVAVDRQGNIYVAEWRGSRIRKISTTGIITTVAGTGTYGFSGDGGPATSAMVASTDLVVDPAGNIYLTSINHNRVRKIDTAGIITTVAGTGEKGFGGDGGPATAAKLSAPREVALDKAGNLYISDEQNNRIRKVTPAGVITTIGGNGERTLAGEGKKATQTGMYPSAIVVGPDDTLYFSDGVAYIRKIDAAGVVVTLAGNGKTDHKGDGGPALLASAMATTMAFDQAGYLHFSNGEPNRIRKVGVS
ncbi:hypothetical protein ALI144C_11575 [Actinosynnema sp. ALI-1.44]|nr:hypothetical protein ALI144C_11575 [Actinosynnema sp. ALI-1.44]